MNKKRKSTTLCVRLTPEELAQVRAVAQANGASASNMIRKLFGLKQANQPMYWGTDESR